jgi:UDP-N-acetylglucosamine 2-epimerase (non-hydrolysing)
MTPYRNKKQPADSRPTQRKILFVLGSRGEAIKMAPVIRELSTYPHLFDCQVCLAGRQGHLPDLNLNIFQLEHDYEISTSSSDQSADEFTKALLLGTERIISKSKPDIVLTCGATATSMATTIAAFHQNTPIGHIEAGMRSCSNDCACLEKLNRQTISTLATCHFTHTEKAKKNLLDEGIPDESVYVTGNTAIDTLFEAIRRLRADLNLQAELAHRFYFLRQKKRLILVTGHHRNNSDTEIVKICAALKIIAQNERGVQIVYPAQWNAPRFNYAKNLVKGYKTIHIIEDLEYLPFVYLVDRCNFIITDSGSLQEKAPSLAKPVLVTRNTTDHPEAIKAGTSKLVGTNPERIAGEALQLFRDRGAFKLMTRFYNPFGDGLAAHRIARFLPMVLQWS